VDKKTLREAQARIGEARAMVEVVRDDEQEKFDEKSDAWKEGDKGQEAEANIETLSGVVDALEGIDSEIEDAMKD
jgi:hypothetical protein